MIVNQDTMIMHSTHHLGEPYSEWLCRLFPKEYAALKLFARKIVKDEMEAEEMVSQALIKLGNQMAVHPEKFTRYEEVRSYLYTSVQNACFDHLRGRKHVDTDDPDIALTLSDKGQLVYELEKRDLRNKLIRLINQLPGRMKEVAYLFFVQGATQEEVEQLLQLDRDTVYVYKNRAVNKLRSMAFDKDQAISPGDALLILWWLATQL